MARVLCHTSICVRDQHLIQQCTHARVTHRETASQMEFVAYVCSLLL